MQLREGQVIGNHSLEQRLGGGAFGEVWLVRHIDLNVVRAMKIPTDPAYVRQLRQEGRIQFSLNHPNIVQTLELNTRSDPPYFVMEYIEGTDLRKRLKATGTPPLQEAIDILTSILAAIEAAHAKGVVHRDLKPENVLIDTHGHVKVADFGLGKAEAETAASMLMSGNMASEQGGKTVGTYDYMSPEQREGQEADPRDDLFAVGIIACELLTGSRPTGAGVARLLQRAGIGYLSETVEKALVERDERYRSAGEMRTAIQEVVRAVEEVRRREEEKRRAEAEAETARKRAEAQRKWAEAEVARKRAEQEDRRQSEEDQRRLQAERMREEEEARHRREEDQRRLQENMSQAPMPTPLSYGTAGAKRPGGLTVLAFLNFVFGGLGALGILAGFIALAAWEAARKQNAQLPSTAIMAIILLVGLVGVILEIASGVGYLGQKKFLGYTLGNAFAILCVVSNLLSIILIGFGFMSLLRFVYPAITLALLNGPFKNSFSNP